MRRSAFSKGMTIWQLFVELKIQQLIQFFIHLRDDVFVPLVELRSAWFESRCQQVVLNRKQFWRKVKFLRLLSSFTEYVLYGCVPVRLRQNPPVRMETTHSFSRWQSYLLKSTWRQFHYHISLQRIHWCLELCTMEQLSPHPGQRQQRGWTSNCRHEQKPKDELEIKLNEALPIPAK